MAYALRPKGAGHGPARTRSPRESCTWRSGRHGAKSLFQEYDMTTAYDVIVVGARCAGSPTAMLLARKGYKVLVVDRATFPSDTVSTHLVHPPGLDALQRWGLLDRIRATGCPPIAEYRFDMGAFSII